MIIEVYQVIAVFSGLLISCICTLDFLLLYNTSATDYLAEAILTQRPKVLITVEVQVGLIGFYPTL